MTTHTSYSFKIKSTRSEILCGIGFNARDKRFTSSEEAFEFQKKYPEFFVLHEVLSKRGDKIVLVKTVTTEEEVDKAGSIEERYKKGTIWFHEGQKIVSEGMDDMRSLKFSFADGSGSGFLSEHYVHLLKRSE